MKMKRRITLLCMLICACVFNKSIVYADMDELTPEELRFLSGEGNDFEYAL